MTTYLNIVFCLAWITSHFNHPGAGRERDCAAALMWKSTELTLLI
jgi:hypothetical protein